MESTQSHSCYLTQSEYPADCGHDYRHEDSGGWETECSEGAALGLSQEASIFRRVSHPSFLP